MAKLIRFTPAAVSSATVNDLPLMPAMKFRALVIAVAVALVTCWYLALARGQRAVQSVPGGPRSHIVFASRHPGDDEEAVGQHGRDGLLRPDVVALWHSSHLALRRSREVDRLRSAAVTQVKNS